MLAARVALAIIVSVAALTISLLLDRLLTPLSAIPQFLIQIPALVLLMDALRRITLSYTTDLHGLTADDVNSSFFFAAPLAAVGASDLMREIRRSLA